MTTIMSAANTTVDLAASLPLIPVGWRWVIKPNKRGVYKIRLQRLQYSLWQWRWKTEECRYVGESSYADDGLRGYPAHLVREKIVGAAEAMIYSAREKVLQKELAADIEGVYEPRKI